jgi:large subunit ribosomal protein L21
MYAIVETGGKQYRVKPGDTVAVERLPGEPGQTLDIEPVLLVGGNGDGEARVGSPGVPGAVVRAEVVDHVRGEKIVVFRYKSKVRYRRKTGHRQALTRLRITDILLDGASATARAESAPAEPPEAVPTAPAQEAPATAPEAVVTAMPASAGEAGPPPADTGSAEQPRA